MKAKHTPGPWRWELNLKSKQLNLCGGETRYDLTVMDFVRWGMGGACPRFNVDHSDGMQLMHRADEMAEIVPERKHHANWFQTINHADAKLIAAAPDLLSALQKIIEMNYQQAEDQYGDREKAKSWACVQVAEVAVNKALGNGKTT